MFISADYLKIFKGTQRDYMHYPAHVHIETVGACNAKCSFCPHSIMDRRGNRMSDVLFEKIVQDLKQIPREIPFAITPSKVNEPLLDKKIFDRLNILTGELPNMGVSFTSNFSLAKPEVLEQLSEVPRLAYIWVSLNSLQDEEYHQLMGLPLQQTVQNVKRLLQLNREKQFVPIITLGRVRENTFGDDQFVRDAFSVFAEFEHGSDYQVSFMRRGQWMGFTESDAPKIPHYPCIRWFELSITCTGQVAFCCMDGLCEYPLGDVTQQSILEIYNQPDYQKHRRQASARRDVEVCRDCSFL